MDLSLYSGKFAFSNGATLVILEGAAAASYPYEPARFSKRNQGRTDSGARYCYTHWEKKHRWHLHFAGETREITDTLATFFNTSGTWSFKGDADRGQFRNVWCVDEEWHPIETYMDLFSFDVTIEET